MKKTARLLIVMNLVVIIIIAFSVFFYNPDKLTPEKRMRPLFHLKVRLLVRNVPDSNEMWLHNFGKCQAVLDSKTEGLCRGVE